MVEIADGSKIQTRMLQLEVQLELAQRARDEAQRARDEAQRAQIEVRRSTEPILPQLETCKHEPLGGKEQLLCRIWSWVDGVNLCFAGRGGA